MIAHTRALQLIDQLARALAHAPQLTPAEWADLVIARHAIHEFVEHGSGLAEGQHATLRAIDEAFALFASTAWEAFRSERPSLAALQPAWWTRLRDAAAGEQPNHEDTKTQRKAEPFSAPAERTACGRGCAPAG